MNILLDAERNVELQLAAADAAACAKAKRTAEHQVRHDTLIRKSLVLQTW